MRDMPGKPKSTVSVAHQDDLALAQNAASGDKRAQRMLVDRLMNRVRTTIGYLSGGSADADDWSQMALVEILRSVGSYRGETKLEYWSEKIAVRTAMRQIKKRRRLLDRLAPVTPDLAESPGDNPQQHATRQALRKALALHLAALKPERRTVVVLRLVNEHTISEIADITGTPVNTVRDRLRLGRKTLKRRILADPVLKDWAKSL